jgi:hypothetical protein
MRTRIGHSLSRPCRQLDAAPLTFYVDGQACTDLEAEVFGKRVLITDRQNWPIAEVVAGYRSQSEAEFSFRRSKTPRGLLQRLCTTGPTTTIRVHLFTCARLDSRRRRYVPVKGRFGIAGEFA